jgi:hypothetical protein
MIDIRIAAKTNYVRFEVFTAVTMRNVALWDVALSAGGCRQPPVGKNQLCKNSGKECKPHGMC